MSGRRWLLPEAPDLIGLLGRQLTVTIEGLDAFAAWAAGDVEAALKVRDCEHRADAVKHEVRRTLSTAFITPLEPEDLYALSVNIDDLINQAKDLVREAEVMACPPDTALAEMARLLSDATRDLATAVARLGPAEGDAAEAADAAIKLDRATERVYRRAMGRLVEVEDLREVMARRELYRRASRIGDQVVAVAERVIYAVVKES